MVRPAMLAAILFTLSAAPRDANTISAALQARYQHARSLRASFFERYTDGSAGSSSESGTVYFSRPGRMRWEYESPEEKLFIVDGTNVWFYVPADHTASRAKLKESSDWRTPLALLTGKADLAKLCRSIRLADADELRTSERDNRPIPAGNSLLVCLPRDAAPNDPSYQALFEVDPQSQLARVLIREPGRVETEFRFGNWEENPDIPEIKFHFQPPPGVAIVDEESLGNEIH
jgi:outer membrane lipoprotein carrier protein